MKENVRLLFEKYARACSVRTRASWRSVPAAAARSFLTLAGSDAKVWHTLDVSKGPELTYSGGTPTIIPSPTRPMIRDRQPGVGARAEGLGVDQGTGPRVCRKGGRVITINPMGYPYHGPEVCGDCWRVYPEAMCALYDEAGLRVELSVCETLEVPGYRRYWPRYSFFDLPWPARRSCALAPIGFPIVCAEDTITIGQKPLDGSPHENTTK